jgi:hypothetical protein
LVFAKFGEHLGPAALGTFLLWNGIVCAGESGGETVLAWVGAFAYAFDFASVAAVCRR